MPIQVQNIGDMCKNKWIVRDGLIEEKNCYTLVANDL